MKISPRLVAPVLTSVYKGLYSSLRVETVGFEPVWELKQQGVSYCAAVWHNELFALPAWGQTLPLDYTTIVSQSHDGEFLAQVLQRFGIKPARGSSSRGGLKALREVERIMKEENREAIVTVDGPRGPRHKAKEGIIHMARFTDSYLLPMRVVYDSKYVFEKAWDKFEVPYPFSKVEIRFGTPYRIPEEKLTSELMKEETTRLEKYLAELG